MDNLNIKTTLPTYSVIIPVFNKELFVGRAIESVLCQSFSNFELIIICDPSSDNSSDVVGGYCDERIKVFHRTEPGPGGYEARNLGIKYARAEWISFLDADDIWTEDHLLKIEQLQMLHPECSLFTASRIIIEEGKQSIDAFSMRQDALYRKLTFQEYLKYSFEIDKPFHTNTVLFKKSLLQNANLFPDGRTKRSGDIYAWVKLAYLAKNFIWSNHIATHLYKDVIGVSKLSLPTIKIFQEMVSEIASGCNNEELKWLKRYANKLIKTAWLENRKAKVELMPLRYYLFWKEHLGYCLFWSLITLFPQEIIEFMRVNRKRLKRLLLVDGHNRQ